MAELIRTGPSIDLPGIGRVRQGAIQGVPDGMVDELLASGEWQRVPSVEGVERLTEPAPRAPAAKPAKATSASTSARPARRSRKK